MQARFRRLPAAQHRHFVVYRHRKHTTGFRRDRATAMTKKQRNLGVKLWLKETTVTLHPRHRNSDKDDNPVSVSIDDRLEMRRRRKSAVEAGAHVPRDACRAKRRRFYLLGVQNFDIG